MSRNIAGYRHTLMPNITLGAIAGAAAASLLMGAVYGLVSAYEAQPSGVGELMTPAGEMRHSATLVEPQGQMQIFSGVALGGLLLGVAAGATLRPAAACLPKKEMGSISCGARLFRMGASGIQAAGLTAGALSLFLYAFTGEFASHAFTLIAFPAMMLVAGAITQNCYDTQGNDETRQSLVAA